MTTAVNSNPTCTTPAANRSGNVTVPLTGDDRRPRAPPGYGKKLTVPGIER